MLHLTRFRGATAARLTPDQEVACSNHVEINLLLTIKVIILLILANSSSSFFFNIG